MSIELIFPTLNMETQALEYVAEHFANGEKTVHGDGGLDSASSYSEWIKQVENYDKGIVQKGHVPATTYFCCRKSDDKIIGSIDIRHELNDFLRKYGGHIGYSIRPTERRKGYGAQMLALALEKCRELGLDRVLITCDKTNIASSATVIKNGGVLEDEIAEENGNILQRYWITL